MLDFIFNLWWHLNWRTFGKLLFSMNKCFFQLNTNSRNLNRITSSGPPTSPCTRRPLLNGNLMHKLMNLWFLIKTLQSNHLWYPDLLVHALQCNTIYNDAPPTTALNMGCWGGVQKWMQVKKSHSKKETLQNSSLFLCQKRTNFQCYK